jgi:thiol-disulfide isomerase/thioredoxin
MRRAPGGGAGALTSAARRPVLVRALVVASLVVLSSIGGGVGTPSASSADADITRFVPWPRETPALSLKDLGGRTHSLEHYRDKVVLLNFWASWCGPCKDELPSIVKLKERMAGRPFDVVIVNFGESQSRVGEFVARERLDLVALLDPNKEAARAWRVRVLPSSFLVGTDGRIRYQVVGEMDWATETAIRTVEGLLPPR